MTDWRRQTHHTLLGQVEGNCNADRERERDPADPAGPAALITVCAVIRRRVMHRELTKSDEHEPCTPQQDTNYTNSLPRENA